MNKLNTLLKCLPKSPFTDQLTAEIKELTRQRNLYKADALQERDAKIEQLTGVAFLACVERDELRMELSDLPEAQSDMLETIKAQRKALGQALEALQSLFGAPNQYYTNADAGGVAVWRLGGSDLPRRAITAIEEVLK